MTLTRSLCMLTAVAALLVAPGLAQAEDAISHPAKKSIGSHSNEMVASLAVLNARGASLDGNTLTLTGVSPNSIVFADRPVHAAGHVLTSHFIREWDEGVESFAKSPPNATISVLGEDGGSVKDAVVVLKSPKLDGDKLTFDVSVLEGDLKGASGAAALFIDRFAAHINGPHGGHVNVVGGRPAWHGAWYARPGAAFGAGVAVGAIGAAAAAPYPYYGPQCGYYPYPPCY
ncbi:hypothetical protein AUC69_15265 [Methyloceanibacter superfactus]|jgi:hypothetical protein|uniref:CHRD domain-containing protein n=1 Tax=Methyloceanibacter superfactus TaxID=1774969 RepID=A0A1E3VRH6_9HYPH|nr:hypothetical protein [Methyloceanibacter superfactus]ODR96130.1 hypothetical protein AUC69_15265 [Methyloceanibacter superfactus]